MRMHIALPFAAVNAGRMWRIRPQQVLCADARTRPQSLVPLQRRQRRRSLSGPLSCLQRWTDRKWLVVSTRTRSTYSEYDRWAGPLDEMVRRVLIADLDGRLAPGMILIENNPTSPASLTIAVDVLRFDADAAGLVTLKARWELLGASGFSGGGSA